MQEWYLLLNKTKPTKKILVGFYFEEFGVCTQSLLLRQQNPNHCSGLDFLFVVIYVRDSNGSEEKLFFLIIKNS